MLRSTLECTQTTRRDTAPTLYGAVSKAPGEKTPRKAPPYHPHGRTEVGGLCPVRRVPRWCHSAAIATKGSVTRKGPAWPQAVGNPLSAKPISGKDGQWEAPVARVAESPTMPPPVSGVRIRTMSRENVPSGGLAHVEECKCCVPPGTKKIESWPRDRSTRAFFWSS